MISHDTFCSLMKQLTKLDTILEADRETLFSTARMPSSLYFRPVDLNLHLLLGDSPGQQPRHTSRFSSISDSSAGSIPTRNRARS